jgi:very-short-patch-repair endonuclease
MADAENLLWSQIRRKQLLDAQFYRQKPIGKYIVDFYAPLARLVTEVDGSRHLDEEHVKYNQLRSTYLEDVGLKILRFNNLQVLKDLESVLQVPYNYVAERLAEGTSP